MTRKYSLKNIGETHTSKEGYPLEIVDGGSRKGYCTVLIDGKYKHEVQYGNVKRGTVKNVLHKSVHGVGYIGIGDYQPIIDGKITKIYYAWKDMIRRTYDLKNHAVKPTYKDVTVCPKWHNFQNFAEWFQHNYIDGYDIDKDLLSNETKVYSPQTCVFVPPALNAFLSNNQTNNTSKHTGVHKTNSGRYRARISNGKGKNTNLGTFETKEEAYQAYQAQRSIYAKEWRNKMCGILKKEAIERII